MSFITASGLVSYINLLNTTAPNNVGVPTAVFQAIGGAYTNIDVALTPKGLGAILAIAADNTATGGNKRGFASVDWQIQRTVATQVASGANAVLGGGRANVVSVDYGTIAGGLENNVTSGQNGTIGGGTTNTADAINATIPGGTAGWSRGVKGALAYGGNGVGSVASLGFSQYREIVYRTTTNNATATPLTTDNSGVAQPNNCALMTAKQVASFFGQVVAVNNATDEMHAWQVQGLIKRPSNAASTVLVASTVTDLGSDAGAAAWTLALAADVTNGGLRVTATGAAGTAISWVGAIRLVEAMHV